MLAESVVLLALSQKTPIASAVAGLGPTRSVSQPPNRFRTRAPSGNHVEGRAVQQLLAQQLIMPGGQQLVGLPRSHSAGVFTKKALLLADILSEEPSGLLFRRLALPWAIQG